MFGRRYIRRRKDGTYVHSLPYDTLEVIASLAGQLELMLDDDRADTRRLYPTAYAKDPEKDAGYQILARDQLADGKRAAIATVQDTSTNDEFTEDELQCWMRVTNDLRLVLGTQLDVSEDDEPAFLTEPSDGSSDAEHELRHLYDVLGAVVGEIVHALSSSLDD